MFTNLGYKERTAIAKHYCGEDYRQISVEVDVKYETVKNWFKKRGKLAGEYQEYAQEMDEKVQEQVKEKLAETTDDILRMTSKIMDKVYALAMKDDIKLTITDFYICWKIQRIVKGLPIRVKPGIFGLDPEKSKDREERIDKILDRLEAETGLTSNNRPRETIWAKQMRNEYKHS